MASSEPGQETGLATSGNPETLPAHSRIGEFEIVGIIGEGGFGTVYLAHDHSLQRHVALKEYRPAALATRHGQSVVVRSTRHAEAFASGLNGFITEARTLARFDHRALVRVFRVWQENSTAYMAMALCEGRPLTKVVKEQPELVNEAWLKAILVPLLEGVETLHAERIYHRDIAPDNVMIQENGAPILLDFGAARHIATDVTQPLTVILKPGYAPIEQFADDASLKQGPWTDIYALGAVLYFAMTGKAPPNSVARLLHDPMKPLASTKPDGYSEQFLHAVDAALSVRPEGRPQSIAEFRAMLGLPAFTPRPRTRPSPAPATSGGPPTTMKPAPAEPRPAPSREATSAGHPPTMAARPSTQGPAVRPEQSASSPASPEAPVQATSDAPGGRRRGLWIVGAAAGVAVLGLAAVFGGNVFRSPPPAPVVDVAPSKAPAAADAPPAGATGTRDPSPAPGSVTETPPKAPVPAAAPGTAAPAPASAQVQPGATIEANAVVLGAVRIVIKPWGEVIVDGVSHGVSPPLKRLNLPEGKHTVEVRNPGFPAYSAEIEVAKNKPVTVFYEFK